MRPLLIILFALVVFSSCQTKEQKATAAELDKIIEDTTKYTQITWDKTIYDFGIVKSGDKVPVKFSFKNTGNKPLYIVSATPGCGCTVSSYTKGAVAPGATGEVTGEFNSADYAGTVTKTITVIANTKPDNRQLLTFTGEVRK